jgi:hypothetical protein
VDQVFIEPGDFDDLEDLADLIRERVPAAETTVATPPAVPLAEAGDPLVAGTIWIHLMGEEVASAAVGAVLGAADVWIRGRFGRARKRVRRVAILGPNGHRLKWVKVSADGDLEEEDP